MALLNDSHRTGKGKVLKRSKTGLETEFHMIDSEGFISNKAEQVISSLKSSDNRFFVTKEIGRSMIEFGCYPDVKTYNPSLDIVRSIRKAQETCDKKGLMLFPFATYPGKFDPVMSKGESYTIKSKIFGEEKLKVLCRAAGFHHHYSMPKGVFDFGLKEVKLLKKSKIERTLVSSYNFEIAVDPVLTLFTQSSPFYQGENIAKDSRVVVYRGGKKLKYMQGAYSGLQQLGGLPPYKQTATDLLHSLKNRQARWEREVKKADPSADFDRLYPFKFDIGWNPVKLNKHGTLEQRGMDINLMSVVVAVAVLLKFCLKKIQREFIEVLPADFGVDSAFKVENGILYIPPHSFVRNRLQKLSAYKGYDSAELYGYAKRFFSFARSITPKRYAKLIRPVSDMIEFRSSVSDRIIRYAKSKGYLSEGSISDEDAASLALYYSGQFRKDLDVVETELHRMSGI